jgi:hypothetical protein
VSEPAQDRTDAGLRGTLRPLRLAAFELTAPLAGLEVALGAAAALTEVLESSLGALDVSPFGSLPAGEGARPSAGGAARSAAVRTRARGSAPRGRPAARRPSSSPAADPAGGFGEAITQALERLQQDVAVASAAERIVPGTGPAAVAVAHGVRAAKELPLLGELAEAAFDAVARPAPASSGAERGTRDVGEPGKRPGRSAGSRPARVSTPDVPPSGGFGEGITRVLEQLQRDVAVASAAERVLPGTGGAAVAVAHGAQAATSLLGRLADTALEAIAPQPAARRPAAPARSPRGDAGEAVRRELDAAVTRPSSRQAPGTPARSTQPADAGKDGARPPELQDPGELAWLVNEALVEQARRHGVDLS